MIKILNVNIEFDFYDIESAERLEECVEKTKIQINELNVKDVKQSVFLKEFCSLVKNNLSELFGEEICNQIFNGKVNFHKCMQAYKELTLARITQEDEIENELINMQKEINEAAEKYSYSRTER